MHTTITCAKCGSTKVVPRARMIDRGHVELFAEHAQAIYQAYEDSERSQE